MENQPINNRVNYSIQLEDGDMERKLGDILMEAIPEEPKCKIRSLFVEVVYDTPR